MRFAQTVTLIFVFLSLTFPLRCPAEFFDPVEKNIDGFTLFVDPALLPDGEAEELGKRALKVLEAQLVMISQVLGKGEVLTKLRSCPIWLEHEHKDMRAMQYHPGKEWLTDRGYDPRLTKKVHIPQAKSLVSSGVIRKMPWVVMHELAHAYHDQIVGHDHEGIRTAYAEAVDAGIYKQVMFIRGGKVRHYALSNIYEYFAEGTEAYFGSNDFYPFVRAELKEHDPALFKIMEEIWGKM